MRDFGFNIYKSLCSAPEKPKEEKKEKKKEEKGKDSEVGGAAGFTHYDARTEHPQSCFLN